MTAPPTVLQITDTHLRAEAGVTLLGVDTADSLGAVLDRALSERTPAAIVVSGDVAHDPHATTYERFRHIVEERFHGPLMYVPGNHDLTGPMAQVLGNARSLRVGGWELIGFDTHADDRVEASFDEADRRHLAARIEASAADHVLLVCHHHLLPVGCPWLDGDCVPRGRELLESFAGHPRVRGLVFGHVHQEVEMTVDGMCALGTPSTCFQFEPRTERFSIGRSAATGCPGYRWLSLNDDGSVSSQVGRLDGYRLNIDLSDRS